MSELQGPLDIAKVETAVRAYLQVELGASAPAELRFEAEFREAPLAGEGAAAVFSFELPPRLGLGGCAENPQRYYAVAGATQPNYYPAYGLSPDEAYSLHIGTLFMLMLRVARVPDDQEPPEARSVLRRFVQGCNPLATIQAEELAGLFRCEDQIFAVYRLRINATEVYVMGADCAPGFYQLTQHPPQVALRLHLGQLIRAEAAAEVAQSWKHRRPGEAR